MSFYFDDDIDYAPTRNGKKEGEGDAFECENCGGIESYLDETTGNLICTQCFTQSQNIIDESQMEMDLQEALDLAGRTRKGNLFQRRTVDPERRAGRKASKPLEDYDQSKSLPNVEHCIRGMQRVLRETCRISCNLASVQDQKRVLESVKSMWMAYLKAWYEAAEYFGSRYPEIRFSFRDYFLTIGYRTNLMQNLTYWTTQRLREDITQEEENEGGGNGETSCTGIRDVNAGFAGAKSVDKTRTKADTMSPIFRMIKTHYPKQRAALGRKAAALMLEPSMDMVGGILLVALSPFGVTEGHIKNWISSGALPLLNAYNLLDASDQKILKPFTAFFKCQNAPSVNKLKTIALALHVACEFRPRKTVVCNNDTMVETLPPKSFKPGELITSSSVPILTARLVSDLGLGQKVLNFSLALMGLPIVRKSNAPMDDFLRELGNKDSWLPEPLKGAKPGLLRDTAKILGVIVVACKLIPRWHEHIFFKRPLSSARVKNESANRETFLPNERFLPWNHEHFRFVGNGQLMEDYLDFLEEEIIDSTDSVLPSFVSSLKFSDKKESVVQSENWDVVHPCQILIKTTSERIIPGADRPVFTYEITDAAHLDLLRPYTPPLGPLIEYMAYKSGVLPTEIINFVVELDKEMIENAVATRTKTGVPAAAYNEIVNLRMELPKKPGSEKKALNSKKAADKKTSTTKRAHKQIASKKSTTRRKVAKKRAV